MLSSASKYPKHRSLDADFDFPVAETLQAILILCYCRVNDRNSEVLLLPLAAACAALAAAAVATAVTE